ncbi:MAG: NifB/NifX family molybdenum-iron cluster-binding protein [Thermoanaerobacteraceae bacterium]|nr:NifB/NifX family molybdenum-iron cluster-binding protein [Thermoanaerobacteraceae bacterium]
MKVAITAQEPTLDSTVEPRLGRCPYFILMDTEKNAVEAIANDGAGSGGGAGIAASQALINRGVKALITGQVGPKAMRVLQEAGIRVYHATSMAVRAALEQWQQGKLTEIS